MIQILLIISLVATLFFNWDKIPKPIQNIAVKGIDGAKVIVKEGDKPPKKVKTFADSSWADIKKKWDETPVTKH